MSASVTATIKANLDACKKAATGGDPDEALKFAQAAATCSTPSIRDAMTR
jgi:hypothetical protein